MLFHMAGIDKAILTEFLKESQILVQDCENLLTRVEDNPALAPQLEEFSNKTDRIMGAAQSLALLAGAGHPLEQVGNCAAICKVLGACGSRLASQPHVYEVTTSFLQDAIEILKDLLAKVESPKGDTQALVKTTLMSRLKWISDLYKTLPMEEAPRMSQGQIDDLINKLGM